MTPAERAATLYTVEPVAGGWAIYGPAWTIIDDCFATREEAEREIQVYAARTIEAIAAAERDAYERAAQACEGVTTTVGQSYAAGCAARIRKLAEP